MFSNPTLPDCDAYQLGVKGMWEIANVCGKNRVEVSDSHDNLPELSLYF